MNDLATETLLRMSEVARILNISRTTAYELAQRGELPVVRFGKSVRMLKSELVKFIQEHSERGKEENF